MLGMLRVAAVTPHLRLADPLQNAEEITRILGELEKEEVKLSVFPELCLTGYTCGDLFFQPVLIRRAMEGLLRLCQTTQNLDSVFVVGLPVQSGNCLYDCAAVLRGGVVLGFVPKCALNNTGSSYELRQFTPGTEVDTSVQLTDGQIVPLSSRLVFEVTGEDPFTFGVELGDDLFAPIPPSAQMAQAGATVILNLAALPESTGKASFRRDVVRTHSARIAAGYLLANAGPEESTQDGVYGGQCLIFENGTLLSETKPYEFGATLTDLDLTFLAAERQRSNAFQNNPVYRKIPLQYRQQAASGLLRKINPRPFLPETEAEIPTRCEEILSLQSHALARRLLHTHSDCLVVGVSGGLDSTLAMIVSARALALAKLPTDRLLAVTMPCFGTTHRTHQNAVLLSRGLCAQFQEINIRAAVQQHFQDIGLPETARDVTYENSQARERTQVLMDLANRKNGLVIGTGDLSELALGWATYNGDHMSMYGVNASMPKTLIRVLVDYEAKRTHNEDLSRVLLDILATPVSPELLPPDEAGTIAQKTEDLVGPYELHDFFLYRFIRRGDSPDRIAQFAREAFRGEYDDSIIDHWLRVFVRRFFQQQFKRSCIPDGPKVGSVSLSPRGDWRMPTDALSNTWSL